MNKKIIWLLVVALLIVGVTAVMASAPPTYTNEYPWNGRNGADSYECAIEGENDPRYEFRETGWIHWVFSTKGKSTDAYLIMNGKRYEAGHPLNANVWHFYTPFSEIETLTATAYLNAPAGRGFGLVISDWCPGEFESLDVSKTVVTSYSREHFWDIDKTVTTVNGYLLDGTPKIWLYANGSGDETATWTVDVTYEGYIDFGFNVSGVITIVNDGQLPAVITDVDDVLGGTAIYVDCGVTFPYTLPVGDTLTCTYDEDVDGLIEGYNVVTVTTERNTYSDTKPIVWGAPYPEINKTVNVEDVSDLFDEKYLGSVTAPEGATFEYTKHFTWAHYGAYNCGSFMYDNTATIVETGQSDDATLKVNVQCIYFETAYAKGDPTESFCANGFSRWGWTNPIEPGNHNWPLWAGAGQCDTSKGTHVGSVTVVYDDDGYVTVEYNLFSGFILGTTHVYADEGMFPLNNGVPTVAPGQYYNASPFSAPLPLVYVIAHAEVGVPDPNFGP